MPGIVSASTCGRITEPAYQMSPEFETEHINNGSNSKSHYRTRIFKIEKYQADIKADGDLKICGLR